ncbi:class I SAM-dependent methyltransferase [Octadecabacter sp. SW4]|uniref:class I SAM-dependent methyltransferase n=1 Tax=Octadecabacter sp. SW4 TaxID=2602067 RepID=UPI0011C1E2A1|nr:class I SAM-dependent methyltransferase [Octadecabacter sp. SW4]QEE35094.1 class I SAM-dependent methyltransferase [Octadecabacter sp. SW4]
MSVKYDKYYSEGPDALGPPTKILTDFLTDHLPAKARVLDVGCGQGRDALWLARRGHRVVGIDISTVGIGQLRDRAKAEGLDVTAHVADVETFDPDGEFDCVLFDRTLHMILDAPRRNAGFARLAGAVKQGGSCVVLDEADNIAGLLAELPEGWSQIWRPKAGFALRRV